MTVNRIARLLEDGEQPSSEPTLTLLASDGPFVRARQRLALNGRRWNKGEVFRRVLGFFEEGWRHIRPLQLYSEQLTPAPCEGATGGILFLFSADVVDLFIKIANACADSIPGGEGKYDLADTADDCEMLVAYMRTFFLAASGGRAMLPPELWELADSESAPLQDWAQTLPHVLGELSEAVPWRANRWGNA